MTKRLRIIVAGALCALAVGAVAVYAAVGGDDGQPAPPAIPSEPVFPSAAQVEPSATNLAREQGDVRVYVTEGAGERAGWVCLVHVAGVTSTSCNPPEAAAKHGIVSSEQDPTTGDIQLWAWLPDGYTKAASAGVSDTAVNNVVLLTLPKSAEVLKATGPAGELELDVPKAVG